ncbi:REP-associated tyrosine transposase [Mucilaginibacter terrae]|uniref:Transposase n=1 Tax=Mucilaginibacter terrae TaxID=1955052 RepID=A0ABU3GWM3_9SPHI|nr:transposase [Mucilaginibacter terrae]MDT3404162.1 putative transposase [Mucilaginibacter terrae]
MSNKYKFGNNEKLYFISFSVVYWIDLFIRNDFKQILINSWNYCKKNKGLEIYGWCIMTSHVHMIIGSGQDNLSDIVRDMKRHTSQQLKEAIMHHPQESRKQWMLWMKQRAGKRNGNNANFQLWQQDNHPIELNTHQILHQKLDYIHNNPIEAGFVEKPEDYLYSSARNYYGLSSMMDVILIDPLVV